MLPSGSRRDEIRHLLRPLIAARRRRRLDDDAERRLHREAFEGGCNDCCGHTNDLVPHSFALGMPLASVGAMLAGEVGPVGSTEVARTAETAAAALEVLRRSISVDVHSHGGNTGITSKAPPNGDLAKA